jgi:Arc/MetJ-type ribon-helix-helix transcriptional regulator
MKKILSITVGEDTLNLVDKELARGLFRNKSHIFEYAVKKLVKGDRK